MDKDMEGGGGQTPPPGDAEWLSKTLVVVPVRCWFSFVQYTGHSCHCSSPWSCSWGISRRQNTLTISGP